MKSMPDTVPEVSPPVAEASRVEPWLADAMQAHGEYEERKGYRKWQSRLIFVLASLWLVVVLLALGL